MTNVSRSKASAQCFLLLDKLGHDAAQRVMDRLLRHEHHPDLIPEFVDDECEVLRVYLMDGQADETDREAAVRRFRAALVSKGKQLAILFATEAEGFA